MPGAERLRDSQPLADLVAKQKAADKLHAAICATPAVAFEPQGAPWRGGCSCSVAAAMHSHACVCVRLRICMLIYPHRGRTLPVPTRPGQSDCAAVLGGHWYAMLYFQPYSSQFPDGRHD